MNLQNRNKYQAEELFEAVADSIVSIRTNEGSGSGVLINSNGILATNKHVVERNNWVLIGFKNKHYVKGRVLRSYRDADLAFVQADISKLPKNSSLLFAFTNGNKGLKIRDGNPRVGEQVFAIGHPLGLDYTLTTGIVSAAERIINNQEYIQIDASINPGNSGGGLYNSYGELVGINTMGYAETQGLNFAIPVCLIKSKYDQLIEDTQRGHKSYCHVCGFLSKGGKYCEDCGTTIKSDSSSDELDKLIAELSRKNTAQKEDYSLNIVKCQVCGIKVSVSEKYCNGCGSKL